MATARAAKHKKGNPLHHLYEEKVAYGLNKVALLGTLIDAVIARTLQQNSLTHHHDRSYDFFSGSLNSLSRTISPCQPIYGA